MSKVELSVAPEILSVSVSRGIQDDDKYTKIIIDTREIIKNAIDKGFPFLKFADCGKLNFDNYLSIFSEENRGTYKCNTCKMAFNELSLIRYLDTDTFKLVSPLQLAIYGEEQSAPKSWFSDIYDDQTISESLTKSELGGWNHIYAFTPEELKEINKDVNINLGQVRGIIRHFKNEENYRVWKEIKPVVAESLYKPGVIGAIDSAFELGEKARDSGTDLSIVFTALKRHKDYGWIESLKSNIAFDLVVYTNQTNGKNSDSLKEIIDTINERSDPHRYKVSVAKASEQAFKEAQTFLKEEGLARAVERRVATTSELNVVWEGSVSKSVSESVLCKDELSALDLAVKNLTGTTTAKDRIEKDIAQLRALPDKRNISLKSFVEILDKISAITFVPQNTFMSAITKSVDGHAHSEYFHHNEDSSSMVQTIDPVLLTSGENNGFRKITKIVKQKSFGKNAETPNSYLLVDGTILEDISELIERNGTCIFGTTIKGKAVPHARAIEQISRAIPMQYPQEDHAVGHRLAVGNYLDVTLKTGQVIHYTITSAE